MAQTISAGAILGGKLKHLVVPSNIISLGLGAGSCLLPLIFPANAVGQTSVGVIQYNVKGGQGGWTEATQTRAKQVQLIVNEVKALRDHANSVDFISLEQADPPLVAEDLKEAGLEGWTTIASQCSFDRLQLSYSPDWELIVNKGLQNPLAEGYAADACWQWGRPYNVAYFHNSKSNTDVLYVIVHMPHCKDIRSDNPKCFDDWRVADFGNDVRKVLGTDVADLTGLNLIVSGDMNELGQYGTEADFTKVFQQFGTLTKSPNVQSCCEDHAFSFSYDHIMANKGTIAEPVIINNSAYPIDPDFNKQHPDGKVHNEEHKAIYGVVTLPKQ
jgi:hypothetical protein